MPKVYAVSTEDKKSVEEIEIWSKDDYVIRHTTGWRWGKVYITVEDGDELEITAENPDGVNVYDYDCEIESLDDGWFEDFEYPEDMDEEEQTRLNELWEEDSYSGWEEDGCYHSETELWFYGPLKIELVEETAEEPAPMPSAEVKNSWPN